LRNYAYSNYNIATGNTSVFKRVVCVYIYIIFICAYLFIRGYLCIKNVFNIINKTCYLQVPYGLVVRIPAFHAGGPGSIPGVGRLFCKFFFIINKINSHKFKCLYEFSAFKLGLLIEDLSFFSKFFVKTLKSKF
jgi:hypothetical protein